MRLSVLLATCAVLAAMPSVAKAELVLAGPTASPGDSFADVTGLPSQPSLWAMNGSGGTATGTSAPTGSPPSGMLIPTSGTANDTGALGNTSPTAAMLDWTTGQHVGIGMNGSVTGSAPIVTLLSLSLNLFNGTSATGVSFPFVAAPENFNLSGGLGSGVYNFVLTPDEQVTYNNLVDEIGLGSIRVGITASVSGLSGPQTVNFRGFPQDLSSLPLPPPPPEIALPAALPLFATGLGALGLLGWRRRRKSP